ncbi:tetratricopeptide repeat protein [Dechloromonas sp. H13]|uniref:tetratricopeptide repeat protein n=1 Tax=Dechloromonas sp. H13 TaxID=2570193 RepID=UPI0012912CB8|nr:tetratricopeptide repeat protein [Dechloromonas sp. H13]
MSKKLILATLALALAGPLHAADPAPAKKPPRKQSTATYGPEDLLARTVFQSILADLALQRGDTELGVSAWADLARRTRDPAVIARATEVAAGARHYDLALELTRLWLQVDPESTQARQTESSLLLLSNRIDDLAPQLAKLLEQDKAGLPNNLMHLNRMLSRHPDKKAVQRLIDRVAAPYAEMPEAHFAMGLAAANADDPMRAQSEFQKALQLRPDWEAAALAWAQFQARQSNATALESLSEFVAANPDARDARLTLARLLISERRYDEARVHFDRLLKDHPDNPEVIYPVAMLALQQGDTVTGRAQLERLLKSDFPDKSTVHFFLGQLDEEQKKPEAALAHFRQVTAGDQYIAARARAAQILLQQGKPEEARELLHATRGGSPAEQAQLAIAEAQLLREAGRGEQGYAVLEAALAKYPDNPELLYETALTAERQGKPEVMEMHLRRLLALKPEHAHALNALGYSLADRNIRLAEAQDLIARALKLAPDDPFIMDSMGWVLFRQGKLPEALKTLETAYGIKADPEIAAHLGEVLWTMGRKDEAARVLSEAVRKFPDNEVLAGAAKKFLP